MRHVLWLLTAASIASSSAVAQDTAPKRYALLIAVTNYEHSEINKPKLKYPEHDAWAIGRFLFEHGFDVDYLLGTAATKSAIETKLSELADKGNQNGVVFVGLWGHGIELDGSDEAMFCPVDAKVRLATDSKGNPLYGKDGRSRLIEPNPETLVGMGKVLDGLQLCGAGSRVLVADCCRESPNRPRGRAFGSRVKLSDLPDNTAAIFACKGAEQAFEHESWRHGALTKSLLEILPGMAQQKSQYLAGIAGPLHANVKSLVRDSSNGREAQNVHPIIKGVPELKLGPKSLGNGTESLVSQLEAHVAALRELQNGLGDPNAGEAERATREKQQERLLKAVLKVYEQLIADFPHCAATGYAFARLCGSWDEERTERTFERLVHSPGMSWYTLSFSAKEEHLERLLSSPHRDVRAASMCRLGASLMGQGTNTWVTPATIERGIALCQQVVREYGDVELVEPVAGGESWSVASAAATHLQALSQLPQLGKPAPEIDGVDSRGVRFKLSDYRGKVVLLDFWGDW